MTAEIVRAIGALTEKEKQTLRLIVRGHDAKSTARSLGLSVHTINERLRDARRKIGVSSSREAARLLFEIEGAGDERAAKSVGDMRFGEDPAAYPADLEPASITGAQPASRRPWLSGVLLMTFIFALLALVPAAQEVTRLPSAPAVASEVADPKVVDAARRWLDLLDRSQWDESYYATSAQFRALNTLEAWTNASKRVRAPLGVPLGRVFLSQENLPAPPHGYEVVKFRTRFATNDRAIETVTLDREDGVWRVVGVSVG